GNEGAAARAFDQILDRPRRRAPIATLAAAQRFGTQSLPRPLDPRRIFEAVPHDQNEDREQQQLAEAETEHRAKLEPAASKPEARPDEPLFDARQQIAGDTTGIGAERRHQPRQREAPPPIGLDEAQPHGLAEHAAQHAAQIADAVDEPQAEG